MNIRFTQNPTRDWNELYIVVNNEWVLIKLRVLTLSSRHSFSSLWNTDLLFIQSFIRLRLSHVCYYEFGKSNSISLHTEQITKWISSPCSFTSIQDGTIQIDLSSSLHLKFYFQSFCERVTNYPSIFNESNRKLGPRWLL